MNQIQATQLFAAAINAQPVPLAALIVSNVTLVQVEPAHPPAAVIPHKVWLNQIQIIRVFVAAINVPLVPHQIARPV